MADVEIKYEDGVVVVRRNGKKIGVVRETDYITWRTHEHFFRKFSGFGLSEDVIEALSDAGVENVIIIYRNEEGNESLYVSRLKDWVESDLEWVDTSMGEEDTQKILPVVYMDNID